MALNVLVVDDSAVMRLMITKVLRLSRVPIETVYEAANGREALECLAGAEVGLVLADINMPVMNGIEMLRNLRERPETAAIPVIVVSTDGSESRTAEIEGLQARLVQKPFSPETLRDAIHIALGVKDEEQSEDGALPSNGPDF